MVTGLWLIHWVMSIWSAQQLESWEAEQHAVFKNQQGGCRQHWLPCSSHRGLHIWIFPADLVYIDQRTRNQLKPERCLDSLRFNQESEVRNRDVDAGWYRSVNEEKTSTGNISRTVANILIRRYSHRLVNGDSWSTDNKTSTALISRRKRGQYPKTSETIRGEHSVSPCRWWQ